MPFSKYRSGYRFDRGVYGQSVRNSVGVPQPQSTLLNGLVAYWKFDEGASLSRADNVGGFTLLDTGGTGTQAGKSGNGLQFLGKTSLSVASASGLMAGHRNYTMATWVYPATGGSVANPKVVAKKNTAASSGEFQLFINTSNARYAIYNSATQMVTNGSGNFSLNTWHFVCVTYTSSTKTVTIQTDNTAPSANVVPFAPQDDNLVSFSVGRMSDGTAEFVGGVDELGKWNRVLTQAEINSLYNASAGTTYPFTGLP